MPQSAASQEPEEVSLFSGASPATPPGGEGRCPRPAEITLSPFYHSAVNAVTEPGRFVACSHYFVTRWMPLLGGEGTRIVLALRSLGYYNPKTGERRDQIVVGHAELAARVGCSEDTLTRQLALDKGTGLPRNPALARFVERERRVRRDPHTGRVWQEENAYRVAMDDPVHPDDWPQLEGKVAEREAQQAAGAGPTIPLKPRRDPVDPPPVPGAGQGTRLPARGGYPPSAKTPGPQTAVPGRPPGPQSAVRSPQSAESPPQTAVAHTQSAVPHKESLYPSLPENSGTTVARAVLPVREEPAYAGVGSGRSSGSVPRPSDALRPQPGQTGFAAFREVTAQLRLLEKKRPSGRRSPPHTGNPSSGNGLSTDARENYAGGGQFQENQPYVHP